MEKKETGSKMLRLKVKNFLRVMACKEKAYTSKELLPEVCKWYSHKLSQDALSKIKLDIRKAVNEHRMFMQRVEEKSDEITKRLLGESTEDFQNYKKVVKRWILNGGIDMKKSNQIDWLVRFIREYQLAPLLDHQDIPLSIDVKLTDRL